VGRSYWPDCDRAAQCVVFNIYIYIYIVYKLNYNFYRI
jgi:hypothetical protein